MERSSRTVVSSVVVVVAVVAVTSWVWWFFLRRAPLPEGLIQANGRIEGDRVSVASKVSGRVTALLVREGDTVTTGQVLARLDDEQIRAKVEQAKQALAALEAQREAAEQALAVSRKEVPLAISTAQAALAHARAQLRSSEIHAQQAERDAARMERLFITGAVERHRYEQAALARDTAQNQRVVAREAVVASEQQLTQAQLGYDRIRAKEGEVRALHAQVSQARAALREAETLLEEFSITAPTDGTVTTRMADIGEVVAAGTPLLTIVNLDRLYLQVYVPEREIGKVRRGLPAQIYSDAFPGQAFPATVRYIASRAQFTPKEVQTPDERVKLVFAVRLYLDENPDHRLTPGLPADALIRWREGVPWEKPRW